MSEIESCNQESVGRKRVAGMVKDTRKKSKKKIIRGKKAVAKKV
jgi:hypothetical protein